MDCEASRDNGSPGAATFGDPGAYTRPWTVKHIVQFDPDLEIRDSSVCQENNRFLERFGNLKMEGEK